MSKDHTGFPGGILDIESLRQRDSATAEEQPSELEMHRADHQAVRAAGFHDVGELLDAYKKLQGGAGVATAAEPSEQARMNELTRATAAGQAEGIKLGIAMQKDAQAAAHAKAERECRHCGWMCRPNDAPAKKFYPLEPQAAQQQAERPLHLGACITDGKLHATVMRSEVDQSITVVATAELDVDALERSDCYAAMRAVPVADERTASEAYDKVDRFLRNNLDDVDYAEYSEALECVRIAQSVQMAGSADKPWDAAAHDVLAERTRQITHECATPIQDDGYTDSQLALAAATYVLAGLGWEEKEIVGRYWPWDNRWWKPTTPRRNLVKAGALILAEIERLDRAAATQQEATK